MLVAGNIMFLCWLFFQDMINKGDIIINSAYMYFVNYGDIKWAIPGEINIYRANMYLVNLLLSAFAFQIHQRFTISQN